MELMLDWDLRIPLGKVVKDLTEDFRLIATIRRVVPFSGRTRLYLIELDAPLNLTETPSRWSFRKRPAARTTRSVLLEVRNPDRLEEEFTGRSEGEFRSPVLIGIPSTEVLFQRVINARKDVWAIGPIKIHAV